MTKIKFVLDGNGVKDLLKSAGVYGECLKHAESMRASAGMGYEVSDRSHPERKGAAVYPADDKAYYDNLNNNTLEKVLRK